MHDRTKPLGLNKGKCYTAALRVLCTYAGLTNTGSFSGCPPRCLPPRPARLPGPFPAQTDTCAAAVYTSRKCMMIMPPASRISLFEPPTCSFTQVGFATSYTRYSEKRCVAAEGKRRLICNRCSSTCTLFYSRPDPQRLAVNMLAPCKKIFQNVMSPDTHTHFRRNHQAV